MIFNYITTDFSGEVTKDGPEGEPIWVNKNELDQLPMQKSIRRRMPFFFEEGTFEIHITWDEGTKEEGKVVIRKT